MLASLLSKVGVAVTDLGIGRDEPEDLKRKIVHGLNSDLLVLSGGVSAGMLDLVPSILQDSGVEQVFHKVKVKPGKPIWFGTRTDGNKTSYVFGLPGNPVSSLVGFELFVKAAVRCLFGNTNILTPNSAAKLTEPHEARGDRPTYWPGCWVRSDESTRLVKPLRWMGSSDLRALGFADVLIFFPGRKAVLSERRNSIGIANFLSYLTRTVFVATVAHLIDEPRYLARLVSDFRVLVGFMVEFQRKFGSHCSGTLPNPGKLLENPNSADFSNPIKLFANFPKKRICPTNNYPYDVKYPRKLTQNNQITFFFGEANV